MPRWDFQQTMPRELVARPPGLARRAALPAPEFGARSPNLRAIPVEIEAAVYIEDNSIRNVEWLKEPLVFEGEFEVVDESEQERS